MYIILYHNYHPLKYPIKHCIPANHPLVLLLHRFSLPRKNVQRNALLSSSFVWCPTMTPQALMPVEPGKHGDLTCGLSLICNMYIYIFTHMIYIFSLSLYIYVYLICYRRGVQWSKNRAAFQLRIGTCCLC
jgi:hypothetical protein